MKIDGPESFYFLHLFLLMSMGQSFVFVWILDLFFYKSNIFQSSIQLILKCFKIKFRFKLGLEQKSFIDKNVVVPKNTYQQIQLLNFAQHNTNFPQKSFPKQIQNIQQKNNNMDQTSKFGAPLNILTNTQQSSKLNYIPTEIEGDCHLHEVHCLSFNSCKRRIFIIFCFATFGILWLLKYWMPKLARVFYYDWSNPEDCDFYGVENYDQTYQIIEKQTEDIFDGQVMEKKHYLTNRYLKYIVENNEIKALEFDPNKKLKEIFQKNNITGWSTGDAEQMKLSHGVGAMVIKQPTCVSLLVAEVFKPLYIFLIFTVMSQILNTYYLYVALITLSAIGGITLTIIQILDVNKKLYEMSFHQIDIFAIRNSQVESVSSMNIIPGDIVFLKQGIKIPFQGIVLEGDLLINQSILTGQSVPVIKKADMKEKYIDTSFDKNCIIFEGSTLIQANIKKKMNTFEQFRQQYGIPILVTQTNFKTLRGQLIRKILFPKQLSNQFQRQSLKFLFFLFLVCMAANIFVIMKVGDKLKLYPIIKKCFDLITIAVPPTIPVSMTIGILYAIDRLKNKSIFSISPNRIIDGGVVDTICFDKTGTLTQDHMDFDCLVPCSRAKFGEPILNQDLQKIHKLISDTKQLDHCVFNMASNHSLAHIEETNEIVGDPMEVKLFEFSGFKVQPENHDPSIIFIFENKQKTKGFVFRRFQFDSDVQRMSVICRIQGDSHNYVYTKGSPQVLLNIMEKSSVPKDYEKKLREYASCGFRILAIASKKITKDYKQVSRAEAESDLQFNGFQIFENRLKPQTIGAITEFRDVQINPIMITGDNPLTGTNIGYKSGILEQHTKTLIVDLKEDRVKVEELQFIEEIGNSLSRNTYENPHKSNKYRQYRLNASFQGNSNLVQMKNILQKAQYNDYNICITGKAFNKLYDINPQDSEPRELNIIQRNLLDRCRVFARTKPEDKAMIVKLHQQNCRIVGMCGDGANDCAALNQANIGLSLSQTEASVAAPFTSKVTNISSMVELVKQSRAGLSNNFSIFNIMAMYALIQLTTTVICQINFSYPPDAHFVYYDLFCNLFLVLLIGKTQTADNLSIQRPKTSLLSKTNLFMLFCMFVVQIIGQLLAVEMIKGPLAETVNYHQGFEETQALYKKNGDYSKESFITNITFMVSIFFYLFSLVGFSLTRPWRKQFYTNIYFTVLLIFVFVLSIVIDVFPWLKVSFLKLKYMNNLIINALVCGFAIFVGNMMLVGQKLIFEPCFNWIDRRRKQNEEPLE